VKAAPTDRIPNRVEIPPETTHERHMKDRTGPFPEVCAECAWLWRRIAPPRRQEAA
jgi:hypothetical protein